MLLTVANVVVVLFDVMSPVRFGILVVDVAVPVRAPTNVVAVTTPEALMFLTTAKSLSVNWTAPAASLVPVGNCVEPIPTA